MNLAEDRGIEILFILFAVMFGNNGPNNRQHVVQDPTYLAVVIVIDFRRMAIQRSMSSGSP